MVLEGSVESPRGGSRGKGYIVDALWGGWIRRTQSSLDRNFMANPMTIFLSPLLLPLIATIASKFWRKNCFCKKRIQFFSICLRFCWPCWEKTVSKFEHPNLQVYSFSEVSYFLNQPNLSLEDNYRLSVYRFLFPFQFSCQNSACWVSAQLMNLFREIAMFSSYLKKKFPTSWFYWWIGLKRLKMNKKSENLEVD